MILLSRNHARCCLFLICLPLFLVACGKPKSEDYWKILSMDEKRHFTVIHTDQARHEQTRYLLECSYYEWGDREMVKGPDSCSIHVGQVLVPKHDAKDPQAFVDVDGSQNDWLTITVGNGQDRVMQGFKVLSAQLEPLK